MHEEVLRRFFEGTVTATELARDLANSVRQTGPISSDVVIVNMQDDFPVLPEHAVKLCDAVLDRELPAPSLAAIGFALMASDKFYWDGTGNEVLANVIADWSCPEIGDPLNEENVKRFRAWLLHIDPYPEKTPRSGKSGRPISIRTKRSVSA
jgi:hypothetical protein